MWTKPLRRLCLALVLALLARSLPAAEANPLETPEQVLRYLVNHRDDISLVSYTVTPSGTPDPADPVIRVNAFRPMPLASTVKILVLAAYAREVAAGRLDPQEPIALGDWDRFYFPVVDGGIHAAALADLGFATDELGFAVDPAATVPLDRMVAMMIQHSDNPSVDLLLARMGADAVRATIAAAGLPAQDEPLPLTGLFLLGANHEDGPLTPARFRQLSRMTPAQRKVRILELEALYLDPAWKADELAWWLGGAPQPSYGLLARTVDLLFPRGNANGYARIMAGVATGTFLSPGISAVMRPHLEWPMADPQIRDLFVSLGTKGGDAEGVVTGASWYIPRLGDFAGKPRVTVLFFRNLPSPVYEKLLETFAQQLFEIRLGVDRAFAERVQAALVR